MHRPRRQSARTKLRRVSYSFLSAALNCPLQGFYEFILRQTRPVNPWAASGQALHYVMAQFFRRHRSTKRFPYQEKDKLIGAWAHFWWGAVKGEHGFSAHNEEPVVIAWHFPEQPGVLYAKGVKVLEAFFDLHHPLREDGNKRLVKKRVTVTLPGTNIQLIGIMDRVDLLPEGAIITDYKPGDYAEHMRETGLQFTIYHLLYNLGLRPKLPGHLALNKMQVYNYGRGEIQTAPLRQADQFGLLTSTIATVTGYYRGVLLADNSPLPRKFYGFFQPEDLDTGDITPRLPRSYHCQYCSFVPQCQAWEQKQLPTARQQFLQSRLKLPDPNQSQLCLELEADPAFQAGPRLARQIAQRFSSSQILLELPEK